ncbi:unnamed protein product [Kluyveromyces dobzhanskii CBS 2104]|uniref:WGS project CCBQ000000000 data, contig 00102 n=1 Tax=Kluyveromyces dobzhanskii CBS 2104 TaxID=1427455 RepID=A0A0A8L6H0_9SACH|nr:unnamed protein product [Kluyveromyces dobzhanskii CBS 2104]
MSAAGTAAVAPALALPVPLEYADLRSNDLEKQESEFDLAETLSEDDDEKKQAGSGFLSSQKVKRRHLRGPPWTPITWHITMGVLVVYIVLLVAFIKFVDPSTFFSGARERAGAGHVPLFDRHVDHSSSDHMGAHQTSGSLI